MNLVILLAAGDYTPLINSLQSLWPAAGDYTLWAVLPLVIAISIVYKATKVRELRDLPRAAAKLSGLVLISMGLAAAGLYGLVWALNHYWFG